MLRSISMKKWIIWMIIMLAALFISGCSKKTIVIKQISLGWHHSSALTVSGQLFTWGLNEDGQLGDGTTTNKLKPVNITKQFNLEEGEIILQVSLGNLHSTALTSMGRIFTWGDNKYGQLGDGTITNQTNPVDITNQFELDIDETIEYISSGGYHVAILTSTGRILTWGDNAYGQLGDGTLTNKSNPVDITNQLNLSLDESIKYISSGGYHCNIITSTGRMFTWGTTYQGSVDDDPILDYSLTSPTDITEQFNLATEETIELITSGSANSAAISSSGRTFIWGRQYYGHYESGGVINTTITNPKDITDEFDLKDGEIIQHISLEFTHAFVATSENRIFAWGNNENGQLGDGSLIDKYSPTDITKQFKLGKGESIEQVSLGENHSLVVTSKNRVLSWGWNFVGQLGDGTTTKVRNSPTDITKHF